MTRRNYKLAEVRCQICGTLNIYEIPRAATDFQGKPQPIWANNRQLGQGVRSFPCRACQHLIKIDD